jgi:hypothetical protein
MSDQFDRALTIDEVVAFAARELREVWISARCRH